jgi:archaellum component FlaC
MLNPCPSCQPIITASANATLGSQLFSRDKELQAVPGDLEKLKSELQKTKDSANFCAKDHLARFDEVMLLKAEIERLKDEVEYLKSGFVHTCHKNCQKSLCVRFRQKDEEIERLKLTILEIRKDADMLGSIKQNLLEEIERLKKEVECLHTDSLQDFMESRAILMAEIERLKKSQLNPISLE